MYCAASKDVSEAFPFQRIVKLDVQTRQHDSWLAPPGRPFPLTQSRLTPMPAAWLLHSSSWNLFLSSSWKHHLKLRSVFVFAHGTEPVAAPEMGNSCIQ